jgi:DNA excision repair protein ERCC-4
MRVVIDDREHALCAATDMVFEKTRLDVGDVLVYNELGAVVLAIERKTVADLTSSLRDGRFFDQRSRLIEAFGYERVVYVVEGTAELFGMPAEAGALMALQFRDRVTVVRTTCVKGTAHAVEKMASLVISDRLTQRPCPHTDGSVHIKARRMPTDSATVSFVAMLCVIPGVSKSKAIVVQTEFGTLKALCDSVFEDAASATERLTELRCGKMRFGTVLAKKVVQSLR